MPKLNKKYFNKYNYRGAFFKHLHIRGIDFSFILNVPRKYREKVNKDIYQDVIISVNKKIAERIAQGKDITLPYNLFEFYLMKEPVRSYFDSIGVARTNRWIDYNKTVEMWKEDPLSQINNDVVYYDSEYLIHICVVAKNAMLKKSANYVFVPINNFFYTVRDNFLAGKLDCIDFIKRPNRFKPNKSVVDNRYMP